MVCPSHLGAKVGRPTAGRQRQGSLQAPAGDDHPDDPDHGSRMGWVPWRVPSRPTLGLTPCTSYAIRTAVLRIVKLDFPHSPRWRSRQLCRLAVPALLATCVVLVSCNDGPVPVDKKPQVETSFTNWLAVPGARIRVDLRRHFNGNNLTYSAESNDTEIATVTISGHMLTIIAQSEAGRATVKVTAENSGGNVTNHFLVSVAPLCGLNDELNPGESCMIADSSRVLDIFKVTSDGRGCIRQDCHDFEWIATDGTFEARKRAGTDIWTIDKLPL